jgi:hypothetical protein
LPGNTNTNHALSVSIPVFEGLTQVRKQMEAELGIKLSFTQVIGLLIKNFKEANK